MVTTTTNNIDNHPFIPLDFQAYEGKRPYAGEEVRNVLMSRVSRLTEAADDIADDREAREAFLRKRKEEMAYKNAMHDVELFDKNPELYTNLFALKETTNGDTYTENKGTENERTADKAHAKICEDQNGNLFLAVEVFKPTDVSFQVHDGKLSFNPAGMTPDQLKEIISWLDHRGLSSFVNMDELKLENADPKTEEMFAGVKDEIKEETANSEEDYVRSVSADRVLSVEEEKEQTAAEAEHTAAPNAENLPAEQEEEQLQSPGEAETELPIESSTLPIQEANRNKAPGDAKDKAVASITKWMDKNKRRGLSYFITHKGGYTIFTAFGTENPDNMDLDGVIDSKTKDVKVRNEGKLYVRMDEKGRLEVSFAMPGGKPLSDNYADRIMDAYKDAGITRVKFESLSDANEGVIRSACGRALMIPVGLGLSQVKFDKMIDAAEGRHGKNNPKVLKYKRDLALELARQLEQKGIDWQDPKNKNNVDCRCVRGAIGSYNLAPFRDWWEDFGLRGAYENIVKSGSNTNAAATIGAAEAVGKLYAAFNEGLNSADNLNLPQQERGTVGYLLSPRCAILNDEEKQQFKQYLNGNESIPMRDMPPEAAIKLFSIMQKTEENAAKKKIEDEYERLVHDEFYRGNAERDAVAPFLTDAATSINNVAEDIKDTGLPPIFICRVGNPKYDFSAVKRRQNEQSRQTSPRAGQPYNHAYWNRGNSYD